MVWRCVEGGGMEGNLRKGERRTELTLRERRKKWDGENVVFGLEKESYKEMGEGDHLRREI